LVWHAEFLDGRPVSSARADEPINPASVVKIATTWWAIETFGPDHRFETRFVADRDTTVAEGIVAGPLYVLGGADPDFHAENAFRVALSLNAHGIRRVEGDLWVDDFFWMGWENGSAGTERDPSRRATRMGARLRAAMDPNRWTPATRRSWQAFAAREKVPVSRPPSVRITGTIRRIDRDLTDPRLLVVHRSKPLVDTLRRFNCYSNNDIERVAAAEGAVRRIETFLAADLGDGVAVETASGLGHNRLTPRQIVGMLRQFRESAEAHRLEVEGLLGVAGCDPGTVTRFYPRFANGPNETSLVGKTGTLTTTDGGVSVLAGFLSTAEGEIVFAVASPGAGGRLNAARRSQEAWLLELLESHGGPVPRTCQPPLPLPDEGAEVEPFAPEPRPVG
jgi:D-alanyl-D-alanine carboxypeptidase/D-alanyl-D-alanine-endopeptidase (penicillin-binding protein 4)